MSKPKYSDSATRLTGRVRSFIERRESGYLDGHVFTEHGVVVVYSGEGHSTFGYAHRGVEHYRHIAKNLTSRGLAMVAQRFAREKGGVR